ncbi:MAG: hypothetical protein QOH59_1560 [Gemmatimonadales bacterium]|nr:hypothetical protein [Gemmatimonadales bacterium]
MKREVIARAPCARSNPADKAAEAAGLPRGLRPLAMTALLCFGVFDLQSAAAQIQVRVGVPGQATYSELHEGLRQGSPTADSIRAIQRAKVPGPLWRRMRLTVEGKGDWNSALISLTRLAELRSPAYADSAARLLKHLESAGSVPFPNDPGLKGEDLEPSLQAIVLERRRAVEGDSAVLADILARIPSKNYNHGDAWVLGRLGAGAADSVAARFRAAGTEEFRVRYLTLLSYFTNPKLVPLLARVYATPDSFGVPKRYAIRASDGLLWIGTRESLAALLGARSRARAMGTYADSSLARGGYDFLANDSSAVISRTGKWLTAWIRELRPR